MTNKVQAYEITNRLHAQALTRLLVHRLEVAKAKKDVKLMAELEAEAKLLNIDLSNL